MKPIDPSTLPSLRGVWAFLGVARAGGFRAGARQLGLSQPAVSAAVGKLEQDLGLELFRKVGRRKVLTGDGHRFAAIGGEALAQWAAVEDRVVEAREGKPSGRLRVGAGQSSLLYLLPAAVRRYRKEHPQVELVLVDQPYEESLAMLRDGSLDLAVRSLSRAVPGCDTEPLLDVRRVLIASRRDGPPLGRRPSPAELGRLDFVVPWRGSTTRAVLEGLLAREGLPCRVALEASGWEAVKLYVAQGLGVGFVPEIVVTPSDRRRLRVVRASHLAPGERYGVLWPSGRPRPLAASAMARTLKEVVGAV
jgi:DNA-binding transcriptional LysR family regulator